MKIVLLGAPGAGKGTQAENIKNLLNIPAISTGAILRNAIKHGTPVGEKVKSYMEAGELVPDNVIIALVKERLAQPDCENGFILDGFPRTATQAEELEAIGVELDAVLSIELPDEEIERRLTGRRVCSNCAQSYHIVHNRPKEEDICDTCGGALTLREDDKPETVRSRLSVYHKSTEPLKAWYQRKSKLKPVLSDEDLAVTMVRVREALGI